MPRAALPAFFLLFLIKGASAAPARAKPDAVLLRAMRAELNRSFAGLKGADKVPLYYLGYSARDVATYDLQASVGSVKSEQEGRFRTLDVDARVGDHRLDNTHQIKGEGWAFAWHGAATAHLPLDADEGALRARMWLATDRAYAAALKRYTKVTVNKAVTAEEEDPSDDFSVEEPLRHAEAVALPDFDREAWRSRLKRLSRELKSYPFLIDSGIGLSIRAENHYLATSEGAEIVTGGVYVRLSYALKARTEDGMDLGPFKTYDSDRPEGLPSEERILADIRRSAAELKALLESPPVEPFTGPAIFRNRAAGVYFHEILGHRLEGHRQKLEDEGQTFTRKLGKPVTAPFLSVYDDPTLRDFRGTFLRGFYRFDDEGVPARRVPLVEGGVLKGFLMSRSPIRGFPRSNGHGRRSAGHPIVARMGNLVVEASRTVPYEELRRMLLEEVRRQGKPYGLVFEDIQGGFTNTGRGGAQAFKVLPVLVYRVYPDGRPDEPVRGVDIVGTPLASFQKIVAAGDDPAVFNGTCGAESGWVPVSAVAPSLLISEIEVEKKPKSAEKPPVLPPPFHDPRAAR